MSAALAIPPAFRLLTREVACLSAALLTATAGPNGSQVVEGAHPYADNTDTYLPLSFPAGTTAVEIIFDERSATETNYDFLRFYCDNTRQGIFGEDKYHGGRGGGDKVFPGVGATASLIIPAASFVLHFHSDNRYGRGRDVRY